MLSERLRAVLNERDISIQEYAEMCDLPVETIRNIYYGKSVDPKLSTALKMADALHLSVNCLLGKCPHTPEERAIIQNYRTCGKHGKSLIQFIARYEANVAKTERESTTYHRIPCILPHGDIRGGIVYDNSEIIDTFTHEPEAYLSLKMTGNDLIPFFCKGDEILIQDRFPRHEEYAVFFKEGKIFVRKFLEEGNGYRLKCLHRQGEDLLLKRMDEIEFVGTCIGVIKAE